MYWSIDGEIMKNFFKNYGWILGALFCTMLWGAATPTIKLGYELFPVDTSVPYNIILFAGIRFVGAGIIALFLTKLLTGVRPTLNKSMAGPIIILAIVQTTAQYILFYLGLAVVPGSVGAMLTSTSVFFTVILATLFFKTEDFSNRKLLATLLGLTGIIVLSIDESFSIQFRLNGEIIVMISTLMNALANIFMSKFSKKHNPMALTGYQFLLGGLSLVIFAVLMGGKIGVPDIRGIFVMLVLMSIASLAYGIWSMLLKIKPTSQVVIFLSFNPVFGAIFSWILLGEDIWNWRILVALLLISLGIFLVNYTPKKREKT
jgi:drug/metabolite transporter (DMT)-like permease